MNDSGSFANAITSTRSYGATNSRMLTEIDTNLITYHLKPTDTLQGLAIRHGVTVEKLKRVNKLWTNEAILAKATILIPSQKQNSHDERPRLANEKVDLYVKPYNHEDEIKSKKINEDSQEGEDDGLGSSLKENDCDDEITKDFNKILSEADEHINTYKQQRGEGSEAFQAFNDILSNIDKTIAVHKNKSKDLAKVPDIPVVAYDNSYQNTTPILFSPTRQHPFLEQGT